MIHLFNSLSRNKEKLAFSPKKILKMFVCGPTVYDHAHIGHARTYLVFDALARYLRSQKIKLFYLQNITNIDDRIIDRAAEQNKKPFILAHVFEKAYYADMKKIGATSVDQYARATDFIPQITKQVETLLRKKVAYEIAKDGIYFNIAKFPYYGKLSGRTVLGAEDAISRIDENSKKINKGDFCLWKFTKNKNEPSWKTSLGAGRPGWHIEDTAITEKFFGPQYDIHGGALDLKFPHHEAEIAQQESASGKKPFVKIWLHTGFLLVHGKKMSKSLNNFITISDFLKKYEADVLRLLVLSYHYRSPVNFSWVLADQNKKTLAVIKEFLDKLGLATRSIKKIENKTNKISKILEQNQSAFEKSLADDFNTALALAQNMKLIGEFQNKIWTLGKKDTLMLKNQLEKNLKTLGFSIMPGKIPLKIKKLADEREIYRINKQFVLSDALRKKIARLGYSLEDTPTGPFTRRVR